MGAARSSSPSGACPAAEWQDPAEQWRRDAEVLHRWGATIQADVLERCAEEHQAFIVQREQATLTLQQAARESGYSEDHLGRLVREGTIPNAGSKHRPRLRRCDVPRKAGAVAPPVRPVYDVEADARKLADRRKGGSNALS